MAEKYTTPGVYRSETDLTVHNKPTGTSIGAIGIVSKKGPINRRILVKSNKEFVKTFGVPYSENGILNTSMYAALEFLKESNSLYVVRTAETTDKYSNVVLPIQSDTAYDETAPVTIDIESASLEHIVNDTTYVDGSKIDDIFEYTMAAQNEPIASNEMWIGSIAPSLDGNNTAIRITNSESINVSAGGRFDWEDEYDDDNTVDDPNYKKVFRLEVFRKTDEQSTWSTTTPIESFMVTRENYVGPTGAQMQANKIINGNSNFIYVQHTDEDGIEVPKEVGQTTPMGLINGGNSTLTDISVRDSMDGMVLFSDKNKVKVNMLLTACGPEGSYSKAISEISATRQDCLAFLQSNDEGQNVVTDILNSRDQYIGDKSYTAFYAGYSVVYDSYSDSNITLPNVIFAPALCARTDRVAATWVVPAGLNRGIIDVLEQEYDFTDDEIGLLLKNNINTVKKFNGIGYAMWTQATGLRKKSKLNRINVRRLFLFIKDMVKPILDPFIYENNTEANRLKVTNMLEDLFESIYNKDGIYEFKVICNETNNTADVIDAETMIVDYYISPAIAVEFIHLNAIITSTGVSLS